MHCGSKRCVSFGSHCKAAQEISEVCVEGTTFEFTCLLFGLCSAPRIFTKLLRLVMAYLRFQGLRTVIYLDDILVLAENRDTLIQQVHYTVQLLEHLGFTINLSKSSLEPTQRIVYLGLLINSEAMKLCLPEEKVQQITNNCTQTLSKDTVTAQLLASVIGRLSATRLAVLSAPLHLRHLQIPANSHSESLGLLQVITETEPRLPGRTNVVDSQASQLEQTGYLYPPARPDHTKPSLQGWGAVCNGTRMRGHWSVQEKRLHINCLELLADSFAINLRKIEAMSESF